MSENAIYEAMSHLGAALIQTIPSDDQIIMDHVKQAHAILECEWRRLRAAKRISEAKEAA